LLSPVDTLAARILETVREPLLLLDDSLRVVYANPSFRRAFVTRREAPKGTPLSELSGGRWDTAPLRRRLERVLEEGEAFEDLELRKSFPGSGSRVIRLAGRVLSGEEAESRMILLAVEDVTDRVELEAELRRHARELERSNQELEQFAYAASHDLQEPLRMVASYLELLERRYGHELEGEAREFIDYAVDGARRMKALINGLLEYSRVGRKEGSFATVDLDELLDDALDDLAGRIAETEAEVEGGPLPTTYGNPDQLRRVLQNLIENALTYHGGEPPRIRIAGEGRDDGSVEVTVSDRGPGIPARMQERVFHLFHQLDPHGEGREGSGMGLAICRKIVERHGGKIAAESRPDGGATFRFTLKLDPPNLDPEEAP